MTKLAITAGRDLTVDDVKPAPYVAPPEAGRTIRLYGWVSTYNIHQVLQLYKAGDRIVTDDLTTGRNLMGIVQTEASVVAPPGVARTVRLHGRVNTYNINQVLQLIEVGDSVVTHHLTTGRNLMGIVLTEAFCDHLDVEAQYGNVQVALTTPKVQHFARTIVGTPSALSLRAMVGVP